MFDVASGGEPPDQRTPLETATPSTLQASPYVAAVFPSRMRVIVLDCPLARPTPVNAQVLIAVVVGFPRIVLAPAALMVSVFDTGVRVVLKLLNTFSVTTPPIVKNPPIVRLVSVPTDVSEELTTVVPRVVVLSTSWLPITNFLPELSSKFSENTQYLSVLLWSYRIVLFVSPFRIIPPPSAQDLLDPLLQMWQFQLIQIQQQKGQRCCQ